MLRKLKGLKGLRVKGMISILMLEEEKSCKFNG
jgi:hypothetical protein